MLYIVVVTQSNTGWICFRHLLREHICELVLTYEGARIN
jgi:hypothetical protein